MHFKRLYLYRFISVVIILLGITAHAASRKVHAVALGAVRSVPYSKIGDPAGARPEEAALKVRPLVVDGVVKEWTTGESHEVTDRSFLIRRALRLNDVLPGEKPAATQNRWVWQRGPWLQVDRVTGHIVPLKLPDYDPGVSRVSWFRDYGAYCGVTASGKSLHAVVAQVAGRKPILSKKMTAFEPQGTGSQPVCPEPEWTREPLRVTFHLVGAEAVTFDLRPGSAVLVDESTDEPEPAPK